MHKKLSDDLHDQLDRTVQKIPKPVIYKKSNNFVPRINISYFADNIKKETITEKIKKNK